MTETVEKTENEKNLLTVFVAGFKNMFNFKTRASKYDYWGFIFANFLFSLILLVVGIGLSMVISSEALFLIGTIIYFAYSIVEYIAVLALTARRLHDTNHSGQLLWLPIILGACMVLCTGVFSKMLATIAIILMAAFGIIFLGVIVWLFILCLRKGQTEENRFGKPVEEEPKYNKFANLYIILYVLISVVAGVANYISDNNSKNADSVTVVAGETSAVTVDANADTNADTQEPVKAETEAQPENSAEVETPAVPMHESAE